VLRCFDHFFVQNLESQRLLQSIGIQNTTLAGDTRFDRVAEIASQEWSDSSLESFCSNGTVLVVGSSYSTEETLVEKLLHEVPELVVIIAPHEVNEGRIRDIRSRYGEWACRWSEKGSSFNDKRVMIIDSIGKLSMIYRYAHVVLIGGGFGKGIHNTLEAAVYGKALFFGPQWQKFDEAKGLIACGAAVSSDSPEELLSLLTGTFQEREGTIHMGLNARKYVSDNLGATPKIVEYLLRK
jgi:3-deoxy-D-manno-octulosonic-acid transferase